MPDDVGPPAKAEGFGGLILYYEEFIPRYLPLAGGRPRSRRSAQVIAKEYNLPIIRVGTIAFIDPVEAAARLRERGMTPKRTTPRRGHPLKAATATGSPRQTPPLAAAGAKDGSSS